MILWVGRMALSPAVVEGDDRWIVEGYAMTKGKKADGLDVTLEAMRAAGSLEGLPVYALKDHEDEDGDPQKLVGRVLSSFVDSVGTFVRVMISKSEDTLWTKIKEGLLRDFSVFARVAGQKLADGTVRATAIALRHLAIVVSPMDPDSKFVVARAEALAAEATADATVEEAPCPGGGGGAVPLEAWAYVLAHQAAVTRAALMAAAVAGGSE